MCGLPQEAKMDPAAFWSLTTVILAAIIAILCAYIIRVRDELKAARAKISAFDHDGDGKPGGSRPR
jgi:hypothetical protein